MASSNRTRRIGKELADINNDPHSQIVAELVREEDLTHLKGKFKGPPDTPYEGGTYVIDIKIPGDYPFRPPTMKFDTRVWHPNVSSVTGAICLDTLSSAWSPVLTIKSALISLQSLLSTPEPKDPQDAEVAGMLLKNPAEFKHKAQEWAVKFAGAPRQERGEGSGGATAETIKKKAQDAKESENQAKLAQYRGYNPNLVGRFTAMGFDVPTVVGAFEYVGIDRMEGQDYELEEAYMGDVTARLFNEP